MSTRLLTKAIGRYVPRDEADARLAAGIERWARHAGDEELFRINVFRLAGDLRFDRNELLACFVNLTFAGIFELNWDFHCTECNAVAGTHHHLQEATSENHCPLCDVDFRNDLTRNVEVTFTPAPRFYSVSRRFLDEQLQRTVALHKVGQIRLPEVYVRGIDCLHVRLFRELFEAETLSLRESLKIGQVCIMFTDIKGSTALYERLGDATAYGLVRTHFEILFREIDRYGGVVVKTIGDSVMASFRRSVDGVTASLAIQAAFRALNLRTTLRNEILVKIGIHTGSTIMVNLNNRLDYFGQTVNMAARIQNSADGGEIVISESVRRDPESINALRGSIASLTRRLAEMKGIEGRRAIYRLNAPHAEPTLRRPLAPPDNTKVRATPQPHAVT